MSKHRLVIGQRFGKLTVISEDFHYKPHPTRKLRTWLCRCDCGNERYFIGTKITRGKTKSCGCAAVLAPYKHGASGANSSPALKRTYNSWVSMKWRCEGHNEEAARNYSDRGITVCDRWRESFENFLSDMGERPVGKTLGRRDNDGGYEPNNCRWETTMEQHMNRRATKFVEYKGERVVLYDLCAALGKPYLNVCSRVNMGWDLEMALNTPVNKKPTIIFRGQEFGLNDFSKLFGDHRKRVYANLYRGLSISEALKIPIYEQWQGGRIKTPFFDLIPLPPELAAI